MPILKYFPSRDYISNFISAKTLIPKWFKDTAPLFGNEMTFLEKRTTFKTCVPFTESFTTGYLITLPGDVICEDNEINGFTFSWGHADLTILSHRNDKSMGKFPWPSDFESRAFAWRFNTTMSIPSGYSLLITHPLNRVDLPFQTLSGVVDNFDLYDGDLPFLLKKGFRGLIPMGTPIAQILPFKRENWKSVKDKSIVKQAELNRRYSTSVFRGWYKNNIWKRKTYE
jgi:hypothetical protein